MNFQHIFFLLYQNIGKKGVGVLLFVKKKDKLIILLITDADMFILYSCKLISTEVVLNWIYIGQSCINISVLYILIHSYQI